MYVVGKVRGKKEKILPLNGLITFEGPFNWKIH